jgi:hypothetical protein
MRAIARRLVLKTRIALPVVVAAALVIPLAVFAADAQTRLVLPFARSAAAAGPTIEQTRVCTQIGCTAYPSTTPGTAAVVPATYGAVTLVQDISGASPSSLIFRWTLPDNSTFDQAAVASARSPDGVVAVGIATVTGKAGTWHVKTIADGVTLDDRALTVAG